MDYPIINTINDDFCDQNMLQNKLQGLLCQTRGYLCPHTTKVWPMRMMEKMRVGTPEVHSDKDLTLLTFDIWHSANRPMDQWSNGPMVQWWHSANRPMDQRSNGPMVQWSNGPIDQWTNGPMDQWTNGPMDQWTCWILWILWILLHPESWKGTLWVRWKFMLLLINDQWSWLVIQCWPTQKGWAKKGNCTIFDWIGWSCLPN